MDERDDQQSNGRAGRAMAKRGVPRISLEVAEGYTKHLWTVARGGTTSEGVLAKQIGGEKAKASGGTWRTKIASLNYWGLIEQLPGAQLKLSDIGLRIVRDSEPQTVNGARRDAVLQVKAYEKILQAANDHELPATAGIAGKFHYDFEMNEADAERAADAFVSSVQRAGIVGQDGVVRLSDAEGTAGSDDHRDEPEAEKIDEVPAEECERDLGIEPKTPERAPVAEPTNGEERENALVVHREVAMPTSNQGLSLRVKIDMSEWNADDVVKVLSTLGFSGPRG